MDFLKKPYQRNRGILINKHLHVEMFMPGTAGNL
jgi:hypothetical protein